MLVRLGKLHGEHEGRRGAEAALEHPGQARALFGQKKTDGA